LNIRSLAIRTELGLAATRGRVTDRGDHVVVETPDDPLYYFGNYLVMPAPPQVGEVGFWSRRFAEELGVNPDIRHVAFRWDGLSGDTGAIDELRAAGFTVEVDDVMIATDVASAAAPYALRRLAPSELDAASDLHWLVSERHDQQFRTFLDRRAIWQRELVSRGDAAFWGAFHGLQLVGSLGLVPLGDVARYQDVITHPDHRKRGIAAALVSTSASDVRAIGLRLVIVTAAGSNASRIYARAGFQLAEKTVSACRVPPVT
jgi:GNAT superfamily N-acetyltransferase